MQASAVTQSVMAGHCEHGNAYVCSTKHKSLSPCTINHAVTQKVEAPHHKPEGCSLDYR